MNNALIITSEKKALFEKLISDLKYALKDLTSEELFDILKQTSMESVKATYETKKNAIKKTSILIKKNYNRYRANGLVKSIKYDAQRINDFLMNLPEIVQSVYNNFLKLQREEQIEVVIVTIITVAIFFTAAGGADLEGGIPDSDIAIAGIDSHRSIITHSIFIGLGIEFTGRFSLLTLEKIKNRMPIDRHPIWEIIYSYIDKHKEKAIAAMWLGIGAHLLKDSGLFGGGVTPYKDLPVSLPIESHQGLFAANGAASGLFGAVK